MTATTTTSTAPSPHPALALAPVVEVALAVQFDPLPGLTAGHLGRLWSDYLDRYPACVQTVPLPPAFEVPGEGPPLMIPGFALVAERGETRLQFVSADKSRMVQVQNGWFAFNWCRTGASSNYPRSVAVRDEFTRTLSTLSAFVEREKLGSLEFNLWEVCYIDRIDRGPLWQTVADWSSLLPGLVAPSQFRHGTQVTRAAATVLSYPSGTARLYLAAEHRPPNENNAEESLFLRSTARGMLSPGNLASLNFGIEFGQKICVDAFFDITSAEAQKFWKGDVS